VIYKKGADLITAAAEKKGEMEKPTSASTEKKS